jgi:tetratricopeptide (TPR) repeat protein
VGDYELLDELGRGGMGVVYRARHASSGEVVALKLLNPGASAAALKRQRREVDAQRRLDHPALVAVRDAGEHQGQPYLVLELVRGESLEERLHRGGPLPEWEAARLVLRLTRGLAHAHDAGVLHRDLKPGNVLLDQDGAPRLTDFGLAKHLEGGQSKLTQTGSLLGSPGYWAPEQARGDQARVGPATDVYGLGAVLYACLTGVPPIQAGSLIESALAAEHQPIDPPRLLRPGVDPRLEAVCLRCLDKDPARRYPSAEALAGALDGVLSAASQRRGARPLTGFLAAAATTLVLALLAGAAWSLSQGPAQPAAAGPRAGAPEGGRAGLEPSGERAKDLPANPAPTEPAPTNPAPANPAADRPPGAPSPELVRQVDATLDTILRDADAGLIPPTDTLRAVEGLLIVAPGYGRVHFVLGRALKQLGRLEEAHASWDAAEAAPLPFDDLELWSARGFALLEARRYADAYPHLKRAYAAQPDLLGLAMAFGVTCRETRRYADALEPLERATRQGDHWQAPYHWGGTLLTLRRPAEALRALDIAAGRAGPQVIWPTMRAVDALLQLEDLDGALARAEALHAQRPDHPAAQTSLAKVYCKIGREREALPLAERAWSADPNGENAGLLGVVYNLLGRTEAARAVLVEARRRGYQGTRLDQLEKELGE